MILGGIFVVLALILTCCSAILYFRVARFSHLPSNGMELRLARASFYTASAAILVASIVLMTALLTHQFQVSYVSQYSSRSLPLGYLISAFWAGQEGTFLLWVLLGSIMGIVYIRSSEQFEQYGMVFINMIQAVLLAILVKKSPFELLPQVPPDGNGLNPLLQNPWMVVHPPVLFVGYAAMAFPFSIALAALARREYGRWVHKALPWTLFTSIMLGAGIVIGGFWAYEVLGWGGYWGWDPVENSSLIPWLTVLALLHGLLIQKSKGSLQRTNFFLAIISFVLVVYATFLTRSGILADFSVHSFQDLGINAFLIVFIAITVVFGGGLFILRFRHIPAMRVDTGSTNRQNSLFVAMMVLCASALVTWAGTSLPIITKFFGTMSQVDTAYYNSVNLPVGIVLAFLLGIVPRLTWKEEGYFSAAVRLVPSLVAGVICAAGAWMAGIRGWEFPVFMFAGGFALWTSVLVIIRNLRLGWLMIGAPLSHLGVALMLIGVIVSGQLTRVERTTLVRKVPQTLLGYTFTYTGSSTDADGKDIYNISYSSASSPVYRATPKLYFNAFSNGMMREPDINSQPLRDVYLSPLEHPEPAQTPLMLNKGGTADVAGYTVTFVDFDLGEHGGSDSVRIAARLEVTESGTTTDVEPALVLKGGQRIVNAIPLPVRAGGGEPPTISLEGIDASTKSIRLSIGEPWSDQIVVEVDVKPFMNVLWLGTIIMVAGIGIAIIRRLKNEPAA